MSSNRSSRRRFLQHDAALAGLAAVGGMRPARGQSVMPGLGGAPGYVPEDKVPQTAVVAYILYKSDVIKATDVLDRETLPKVQMPNRHGFVPDKLEDIPNIEKRGCYKTYGVCP